MSHLKLDCNVVQDLLPLYVEGLVCEEVQYQVGEHLAQCKTCMDMYLRMNKKIELDSPNTKPSKKQLLYISSIRLWYMLCPSIALILIYYDLNSIWKYYQIVLVLISGVFIASQFLSGIDYDQLKRYKTSEKHSKMKWKQYYVSPLVLCLPAILVIVIINAPQWYKLPSILFFGS